MTFLYLVIVCTGIVAAVLVLMGWLWRDDLLPDVGIDLFLPDETVDVHIAPSPTLRRIPTAEEVQAAERAGEFAAALTAAFTRIEARQGPGRHWSTAPQDRDPRLVALLTTTAEYDAEFLRMVEQLELPMEVAE